MLPQVKKFIRNIVRGNVKVDHLSSLNSQDREIIAGIRERNLTYLSDSKLACLTTACRIIEDRQLPGIFIEAGCALGGSSVLMASIKSTARPFFIYDVFDMIPPPAEHDSEDVHQRYKTIVEGESEGIGGDRYYGYEDNLLEIVQSNLKSFGIDCKQQAVTLVKGLVQDTMKIDGAVALAHIDVDWFDPVMVSLQRIFPHLVVGGSIILDDYHDWGGCRKATDEYLLSISGQFVLDDTAGSMKITRK
jgi:hypothetical protein